MFIGYCGSVENILRDYDAPEDALKDAEVLLACYTCIYYEGNSFVLFRKDGKLWEVNGSHCSCYGLEGQWDPEETTPEALLKRKLADSECTEKLREIATSLLQN